MIGEKDLEREITHLARKYGGANLLWGAALALGSEGPDDYGIAVRKHVAIRRVVKLTLTRASNAGGR